MNWQRVVRQPNVIFHERMQYVLTLILISISDVDADCFYCLIWWWGRQYSSSSGQEDFDEDLFKSRSSNVRRIYAPLWRKSAWTTTMFEYPISQDLLKKVGTHGSCQHFTTSFSHQTSRSTTLPRITINLSLCYKQSIEVSCHLTSYHIYGLIVPQKLYIQRF